MENGILHDRTVYIIAGDIDDIYILCTYSAKNWSSIKCNWSNEKVGARQAQLLYIYVYIYR